jgi:DNA modification methylase
MIKNLQKNIAFSIDKLSEVDIKKKLSSLGRLDKKFKDKNLLLKLSTSSNKDIRYLSVSNLAKLNDIKLLDFYKKFLATENVSLVRREIASAIGRLRNKKAINLMTRMLRDKDPNVVLQAIRGLLVFKKDKKIDLILKKLKNHKNEIVRKIIGIEFYDFNNYSTKHSQFPEYLKNCIVNGDVLSVLKEIKEESVHLTFTSPPYYNARDYSIYDSYESYLEFLTKTFKEIHRVTKEGRFFVLNTSPIIIPRAGRKYSSIRYPIPYDIHHKIIEMGWEYIDDIVWMKPEPSAKNRVAGFNMHRKPLAYKPNCITETLMVYRKKTNKLIDWIFKQYPKQIINKSKVKDGYQTSNVWKIDPSSNKKHSAIFPVKLCDNVINYYSLAGDLVFDPFAGSGSVGESAIKNNRYFFLTEINKSYSELMKERLKGDLFNSTDLKIMDSKTFKLYLNGSEQQNSI